MKIEDLKKLYGAEYPKAVTRHGVRMPLKVETRFSREYCSQESAQSVIISRFMDGSASMPFVALQQEWPDWNEDERVGFCQESSWLHQQPDYPDMLRFIVRDASPEVWSAIANSISHVLPRDEAFLNLNTGLRMAKIGRTANLVQGIAHTRHPQAEALLRQHLSLLWTQLALWVDDDFLNWTAFDATMCIKHLVEMGTPAENFTAQVRDLSTHVCLGNRESCQRHLVKHYPWLK